MLQPHRISRTFKPTITDAQEDFVLHLFTINDLEHKLEQIRKQYLDKKIKLQPRIIVVGSTKEKVDYVYLLCDNIKYKFDSFRECLDIAIKLIFVFNLEFSVISKLVWIFFSQYFFEISPEICYPNVETLINKLKID